MQKETKRSRALDLLQQEAAWLKKGLFSLLFVYFFVRSDATHSKISLDQEKKAFFDLKRSYSSKSIEIQRFCLKSTAARKKLVPTTSGPQTVFRLTRLRFRKIGISIRPEP
jgi:hypothetical protein